MFSALENYRPQMLSILRIFLGLLYLQFGLSKYFGWPGAQPQNFTMLSLIGVAGIIEIVGSLLLLVGLWTREAAFIMSGEMAVAYFLRRVQTGASFDRQWRQHGGAAEPAVPLLRVRGTGALEHRRHAGESLSFAFRS